MKLKQKPQLDYVYRQGKVPVLSAFSMRIVLEWHPADGWEKESASLNFTWTPSLFLFLLFYTLWITLNTHIVLHYPDHHNALWFSIRSDIRNSSTFNLIWIFCINSPHPNVSTYNTTEKKREREMWISFLCHCVFRYSSLRSRWLLRSECSTALMGWFGIQLDAGSYFGMPDKVFWWRTIAAASGDSLMVYGWEHTPCLWLHKTMHYVLFFPYHTISHNTTHHTGQRHTTSGSQILL